MRSSSAAAGEGQAAAGVTEAEEATRTRSIRELFTSPHAALAVGILLLEFSTGVSIYLTGVVVPAVIADLDAAGEYPLILSATAVGLFLSLALASRSLARFGGGRVLAAGLALTVIGAVVSAAAVDPWMFAVGRLAAAFGSGLLGVFGTSAIIASVPQGYRVRLLALTSAMWIIPGLLGPPVAVVSVQAVGWRITLLLVLPLVLVARVLVGRSAIRAMRPSATVDPAHGPNGSRDRRTFLLTLLLPAGMAVFAFGSGTAVGPYALAGLVAAVAGSLFLLPAGTWRAAPGPPRYLALLAVVSFGYFGTDSLMTAIGTRADGIPLAWMSTALGASAVCWSLGSLVQPRLSGRSGERTEGVLRVGVSIMALAAAALVGVQAAGALTGPLVLLCWSVVGAGMGLAYPTMYLRSITVPGSEAGSDTTMAAALATAVLVAESIGTVIGTATGSAVVDIAQQVGRTEADGLHAATVAFVAALVTAAALAVAGGRRPAGARDHRAPSVG